VRKSDEEVNAAIHHPNSHVPDENTGDKTTQRRATIAKMLTRGKMSDEEILKAACPGCNPTETYEGVNPRFYAEREREHKAALSRGQRLLQSVRAELAKARPTPKGKANA
jgi:hypothetical protein